MNAGTHLGEIADLVKFIEVINLSEPHTPPIRISKRELDFSYRTSGLLEKHPFWVILNAGLVFERRPPEEVSQRIQETLERRKSTQPLHAPSCGSVFRNPAPTIRAWQVIENLGLRGSKIGGAQVSEKHSNFIINCGNARASDVYALIRKIQSEAQRRLGIHLEPEVQVMGDFILQDRIES
jgi:UDP-N-acetylmuramate dehydrogenase